MNQPSVFSVRSLPTSVLLDQEHRLAGQQQDNLCGPYWAAILLRAYGVTDLDAEHLASLAGSVLPSGDPANWLPPGISPRQNYRLMAYLNGKEITVPAADWDVGHFLTLAGTVEGVALGLNASTPQSLILVRDTYPIFGWDGYHLQSAGALAAALCR